MEGPHLVAVQDICSAFGVSEDIVRSSDTSPGNPDCYLTGPSIYLPANGFRRTCVSSDFGSQRYSYDSAEQ
jgi:hypothetical protein